MIASPLAHCVFVHVVLYRSWRQQGLPNIGNDLPGYMVS